MGIGLGPNWAQDGGAHFGNILGIFWIHVGPMMGPCLGPYWVHIWAHRGPILHIGSMMGPCLGPYWVQSLRWNATAARYTTYCWMVIFTKVKISNKCVCFVGGGELDLYLFWVLNNAWFWGCRVDLVESVPNTPRIVKYSCNGVELWAALFGNYLLSS
jgi:hypothetical protein